MAEQGQENSFLPVSSENSSNPPPSKLIEVDPKDVLTPNEAEQEQRIKELTQEIRDFTANYKNKLLEQYRREHGDAAAAAMAVNEMNQASGETKPPLEASLGEIINPKAQLSTYGQVPDLSDAFSGHVERGNKLYEDMNKQEPLTISTPTISNPNEDHQ